MNHISVGIYASGQYVINIVKEKDLANHIEYNKTFRFGRALFVDGKCLNKGYLSDKDIAKWTDKIKNMNIDSTNANEIYV